MRTDMRTWQMARKLYEEWEKDHRDLHPIAWVGLHVHIKCEWYDIAIKELNP